MGSGLKLESPSLRNLEPGFTLYPNLNNLALLPSEREKRENTLFLQQPEILYLKTSYKIQVQHSLMPYQSQDIQ